jgi:hypothetical protein
MIRESAPEHVSPQGCGVAIGENQSKVNLASRIPFCGGHRTDGRIDGSGDFEGLRGVKFFSKR